MAGRPDTALPPELATMLNLMAHPAGMMASGAAIGFGVASHAYGLWLGAMTGSLDAAMRMMDAHGAAAAPRGRMPVARTRAAVDTLIADAESTAREVVGEAAAVAEKVKRPLAPETAGQAPKARAKPARPDDLKAISGIGPKLEQVLNGLGVWTYAQIAAWTKAEIAWIEDYLAFKGRVARDGWLEQAASLARRGGK